MSRFFIVLGGLFGACGVGLAAAASHMTGPSLAPAAQMLLVHATALLAVGLHGGFAGTSGRILAIGGLVLAVGTLLFSGQLALRSFTGHGLLTSAAPTGGMLMIAGWLTLAVAGLVARRA
jgi:uncharacterized membrane protein YgdD (TMEM256/DUF423 family)